MDTLDIPKFDTTGDVASITSNIPICDGTRNAEWKRRILEVLDSKGLTGFINGSVDQLKKSLVKTSRCSTVQASHRPWTEKQSHQVGS